MVALPDRTAFQGMRQQTVSNARNLDSVAIAPPVSTAPPPRPEVDPAVRAPTPVDLWRTANDSFNNRLNSDQNYLNLQQQSQQLSQSLFAKQKQFLLSRGISNPMELQPRNMAEFQNNPRQPIIEELKQFINSQPEMQQLQNIGQQVSTYVNNTYAADLQRIQSLNNQASLYQQQLYDQQTIPSYGEQAKRRQEERERMQQRQQAMQPAPPQILAPPPKPEVDPEEKIPESFTPAVPTSTNTNMVVDPIRQPFVPKPVKPEVDPEEKILKVPDRKSTTDYEDFVRMTGGGGRPLVSPAPPIAIDTTGAKHSGQGIGGQGGIPALPNRGPQMIVDPIRQPFVPEPVKPEVDPEENIPNTLVSKPKRKAGMAPSQYGGINTNVRGLMG